jgi:Cytochrome P450
MLIITEFLTFLALAFLLSLLHRNFRFLILSWKIPSLKFSIVKNLRRKIDNRTICKLLYDHLWQVQNVAKVWLGPCFFVIVASPEYVKVVMNKCLDKAWMVDFMQLEQSVLFGSGNVWQTHRKIMSPYFGVNTVKNLIPMFQESARLLIENVEKKSGRGEFDVFNFMAALTLETVLKAMELEVDLQNQEPKKRDVAIENLEM